MSPCSLALVVYTIFSTDDLYMSRSDFADIGVYAHICACHDKAAQRYFGSINDAA